MGILYPDGAGMLFMIRFPNQIYPTTLSLPRFAGHFFYLSFRPYTVSMRITLVLPLSPLVLPPVMTTVSPFSSPSVSRARRRA